MSTPITPLHEDDPREQEELEASSSESSFGDILNQFEQSQAHEAPAGRQQQDNKTIEATVVTVSDGRVFFDVGQKTEGVLDASLLRDDKGLIEVKAGDKVRVQLNGRDDEGYLKLSVIQVERPKDWSGLQKAFDEKLTISGVVTAVVKGGLSVDVGMRAFMPASRSGARDVPEMSTLVGQEISCRIIKLDTEKEDIVVDRRAVLEEERAKAKESRFGTLETGSVVEGTVRSLLDYGAFVDIGGIDGMLHVADISWGRVNKPADVLTVGQKLTVQILKVDAGKKRVSLGLKQLQPDPWSTAADKYSVGQRVKGTVARTTDFGAFVELEPGLDGLIHLSEMSWSKKVRKPSDVVKPGELVEVVVLGVSVADKRISLGLKQTMGDPWEEVAAQYPVGAVVEGPITQLKQFGAFVQVTADVEGMIHVGDIVHEKRINHPKDELQVGQVVRAQVLECDREKRRLRLGMKQLLPTAADEYIAAHNEGDVVTGRISDVKGNRVNVDLGEGVHSHFNLAEPESKKETVSAPVADISQISNMLAARWKGAGGGGTAATDAPARREVPRTGQVRSFKITKIDADKKRLEIELAG
ncbi:MAG: ribosomal protein [Bryobacterales bacterium]|nr:ribosomal protein [Bryobacterales bacterium]